MEALRCTEGPRYCFQLVCEKGVGVTVVQGMREVVLSLPKPPGSSLVPLHMTWLSFESISSSTLTLWTPARDTESGRRKGARVRGAKRGMIRAAGEGGQMEGA